MKKTFIKVLLYLSFLVGLSGEEEKLSVLEYLWDYAISNNIEIKSAEFNKREAEFIKKNYWKKFIPNIEVKTSSSFNFDLKNVTNPEGIDTALLIKEKINSGTSFYFSPVLSVSKNLLDYNFEETRKSSYDKAMNLNVGLIQKAGPFLMQKINPEKQKIEIEIQELECLRKIEIENCIKQITTLFIEYRKSLRNLESLRNNLEFLEEKKQSLKELCNKGMISVAEVFKFNDEIKSNYDDYFQLSSDCEKIKEEIAFLEGFSSSEINKLDELDVFEKLPEIRKEFDLDPEEEYLFLKKQEMRNNSFLERQNESGEFQIDLSFPLLKENQENGFRNLGFLEKKNWSVSVSFDFIPHIESVKQQKLHIKNYDYLYDKKIDFLRVNRKKEICFYEYKREETEKNIELYSQNLEEKRLIREAYELLYQNRKCSLLELKEIALICENFENEIRNFMDDVWYFDWLIERIN